MFCNLSIHVTMHIEDLRVLEQINLSTNSLTLSSALVVQTFQSSHWDSTWFMITSKNAMTLLKMLFIKMKI